LIGELQDTPLELALLQSENHRLRKRLSCSQTSCCQEPVVRRWLRRKMVGFKNV